MTDDDFKRHLHRQLEEDKKNQLKITSLNSDIMQKIG